LTGVASYIKTNAGYFFHGDVFEVETRRGGTNYIYFSQVRDGWVYYLHGQKALKIRYEEFLKLIDYGDIVPVPKDKVDPERLSLAALGLAATAQGLSFNDYLNRIWGVGHGSQVM
jgi:hypothetical protein